MQVGFTGTQRGMTNEQKVMVRSLLEVLEAGHVHHGDCVGADADFHAICRDLGLRVEVHPPTNQSKRAFCDADIRWPAYPYMERNQHIVNCADVLISTPGEPIEQLRSGTWATVRRARKKGIQVYIVSPTGALLT